MSLPELRIMAATDAIISSPNGGASQNELSFSLSQAQHLRVSVDPSKLSVQPMQAQLPQQLQIPKPNNISLTTVNVVDVTTGDGIGQNDNTQGNGIFLGKSGSTKTLQSQSQSPQGYQKSKIYSVLKLTPQQLNQLKLGPYIKNSLNPAVIINHQGFAQMKSKKQIFGGAQRVEDTSGYKVKLQMVDDNGQPTNSSRKHQHQNIQGGGNSRNNVNNNNHHKTTTTTTTTEKHGTAVHHHHHHHHHQKLSVTQIQVSSDEYFTHSISEPRIQQKAEEIFNAAAASLERENDLSLPNINKSRHVLVVETSSPRNSGSNNGAQQAINSALRASEVAFAYRSMLKNSVVGGTSPAGIVIGASNQSQFVAQTTDSMGVLTQNTSAMLINQQQQNQESFLNPPLQAPANITTIQSNEQQQILPNYENNGDQRQQSVTLQIVNAQINAACNSPPKASFQIVAQDGSGSSSSKNFKNLHTSNKFNKMPSRSIAVPPPPQANNSSPYQSQFKSSTGDQASKKLNNVIDQQNQSVQSIQQTNSMSTGALNRALRVLHSSNENDESKQQDTIGVFDGDEQQYSQDEFEDALPSQLNRKEEAAKCESQPSDSHTIQRGNRKDKQKLKQHTQETINVTKAKLSKGMFELAPIPDSQKPLNLSSEEHPHTKFPSINMRIQQVVPVNDFSNSQIARGRRQTQEETSTKEKKEVASKRNNLKSPEEIISEQRSFQLKHIPSSTKSIQQLYGGHNFNSRSQSGTGALNGQTSQSSLLQKKVKQNNFYATTDKSSKNMVEPSTQSVKHSYSSNQTLPNHSQAPHQTLIDKKKYSLPLLGINEETPLEHITRKKSNKEEAVVKKQEGEQNIEEKTGEDKTMKDEQKETIVEKDESVFAEFLRNHLNKFNNALSSTAPSELHDVFKVSNDITGTTDTTYTCDLQLKMNVVIAELFSGNFNLLKTIIAHLKNTIKLLTDKWEVLGGGPVPPQKKVKAKKPPKEHPSAQNIVIQDVDKTLLTSPEKEDDKINNSVQVEENKNGLELRPLVLDNDKDEAQSLTKNTLSSKELSAPESQNSSAATSPDRKTKARAAMKSKILSMAKLMSESVGNTPASKSKSAKVSSVNIVEAVNQIAIPPPQLLQANVSINATETPAKTDEIDQDSNNIVNKSIAYDPKKPPLAKDTKEMTLTKQNTLKSNQTNEQSTSSKQNIIAAKTKAKNATQFLSAISHKSVSTKEAIYHNFEQKDESKGNNILSPEQSQKSLKPTLQIRQSENDDDLVVKNARKNKMQMLITMAKDARVSEMSGISHSLNNDDTPNVCQDSIAFPSSTAQKPQIVESSTSLCGVVTGENQSLECGPINGDQTPKEIENRMNGIPSKLLARRAQQNQGKSGMQPEVQQITISIEEPKPEHQQQAETDQNKKEPQKQVYTYRSNKSKQAENNAVLGVHRRVSGQAFFNELVDVLNIVAHTQEMEFGSQEVERVPEEDEICIEDHKEEQKPEKVVKSDHDDVQYLNTQRTQEPEQQKMRRTAGFFNTTDDIKIVFNENFLLQGPGLIQKSEEDRLYELPVNLNLMSSDTIDIQNAINRHSYDDSSQNTRSDLDYDHMSSNTHKRYSRSLQTKKSIISRHSQLARAQRLLEKQQLMKELQERKVQETAKFDTQLHNIHTKFVHAHANHSKLLNKKELISLKAIKEAEEEAPLTGAFSTNDLLALFPDEDFTYKRPEKPQKHFEIHHDEKEI